MRTWHGESVRERFGVTIDFPILEDVSIAVVRRCGRTSSATGYERPPGRTSLTRKLLLILETVPVSTGITANG